MNSSTLCLVCFSLCVIYLVLTALIYSVQYFSFSCHKLVSFSFCNIMGLFLCFVIMYDMKLSTQTINVTGLSHDFINLHPMLSWTALLQRHRRDSSYSISLFKNYRVHISYPNRFIGVLKYRITIVKQVCCLPQRHSLTFKIISEVLTKTDALAEDE